jgi:Zn-dependent peptidase ImmA (M78 family)
MSGDEASLAEIRKISKAISVPLGSIGRPESGEDQVAAKLLLRQTIDQRARGMSSSLSIIGDQLNDILSIARFLPSNLNWLELFRGLVPSSENAENFASIFRRAFAQLDDQVPFQSLSATLEELGVFVCYGRDPKVEGVSAIVAGHALILLAPRTFKARMLFTLAHEVGHLVARHDLLKTDFARLDEEVGGDRSKTGSAEYRSEERFADAFAASLLMPRKGFLRMLDAVRTHYRAKGPLGDVEILTVAIFFGVSFEVAARRCEDLGLLEKRGARALYQMISDEHGNPEKRARELGLKEREEIPISASPRLLEVAAKLVEREELSAGKAAELLNVPISYLFAAHSN